MNQGTLGAIVRRGMAEGTVEFHESQRIRGFWFWVPVAGLCVLAPLWYLALEFIVFRVAIANMNEIGAWAIVFCSLALLLLPLSHLQTKVRADGIYVRMLPFQLSYRTIPLASVKSYSLREYSGLNEYGGWGVRYGFAGKAYSLRGNRGIQLRLTDDSRVLIGTQEPDKFVAALTKVLPNAGVPSLSS